ncbi:response regulator [Desertivirga arenae]|uniref:response regulator n=1 Tax=Desertivirga arenae TaxID=2810309 RepID=UPI001A961E66|nr:response regulator [Pedobacter sp. SYSU D00823]
MKKVLIIEEDLNISEIFHLVLSDHFCVKILHNTNNAYGEIEKFRPDLLLLDHWLGKAKLAALINKLKNDNRFRKIPVIISSTDDTVTHVAEQLRADSCLPKPFDLDDLLNLVRKHLEQG